MDTPDIRFNSLERRDNGLNPDTPFCAIVSLSQMISRREMRCSGFRFRLSVLRAENTLVILFRRIHPRGNPKVRDGFRWALGMAFTISECRDSYTLSCYLPKGAIAAPKIPDYRQSNFSRMITVNPCIIRLRLLSL